MMKTSEKTITTCFTNVSHILKETTALSSSAEDRGLSALAKIGDKLDSQAPVDPSGRSQEKDGDSLEKVSFYIDLALNTFQSISGPISGSEQQASFIFALSETYETLGDYQRALTNYQAALNCAEPFKSLQGQIRFRMARVYSELGDWQNSQDLLDEAIPLLQAVGNDKEVALAQIERAKIAFRRGSYQESETLFESALETSERISDTRSRAIINNHLGIIRRMEGDYNQAYLLLQEALIGFQSIQDSYGAAESLNNLGILHSRKEESDKAIAYFEKALKLCHEIGHFSLLSFVYLNKTEYYCERDDYPMASHTCGLALQNLTRLNNPIGIAKASLLFGRIFRKSADVETAAKFYQESIRLYREFDIPFGLANCCKEFADMLMGTGRSDEAAKLRSEAKAILATLGADSDSQRRESIRVVNINRVEAG